MSSTPEDIGTFIKKLGPQDSLLTVFNDLGYKVCVSADLFKNLLQQLGYGSDNLKEELVSQMIAVMAKGGDLNNSFQSMNLGSPVPDPFHTWNTETFVKVIREMNPNLNWTNVVKGLDIPEFRIMESTGFRTLMAVLNPVLPDASFPGKYFISKWKNSLGQVSLVKWAIQAADLFNFSNFSAKKIITFEELTLVSGNSKNVLNVLYHQTWNCLELIELVTMWVNIPELKEQLSFIIENGSKNSPELVCLGLANFDCPPLNEVLVKLVCGFLLGQQNSGIVLPRLWHISRNLVLLCMAELHKHDPTCLSRLLDVAQEIKGLTYILENKNFAFSIDMAALASRREHLNLEKWLSDNIKENKHSFLKPCLEFVSQKLASQLKRMEGQNVPPFIPLSAEVVAIFFKLFQANSNLMEPEALVLFQELQSVLGQEDRQQQLAETQFPQDIEEESNSYFERVYSKDISVKQMIDVLATFKASKAQREQDVFACMIHNLFDEYRFFPRYPEKELNLTAVLFGSLIQYQLISYIPLGIALRYVLEALRKPVASKMFKFGLQALIQFQSRLGEWPQYCAHLLQISHLQQVFPDLAAYIKQLSVGPQSSITETAAEPPPTVAVQDVNQVFTAIRLDQIIHDYGKKVIIAPEENIQDKILFLVNNISSSNVEEKSVEMSSMFHNEYIGWFSSYLVQKRVAVEPNYHSIYLQMLTLIENKELEDQIIVDVYTNISDLLNNEKTLISANERALLKNLGSWLGAMTIARNKPILYKHVSFKDLLLEGYEKDRLIVVIPFVCKVLEHCAKSVAFRPPNPWLVRLLRLLLELYHFADLKLNLKFEVEVLCKNIQMEINEIEPSQLLKNITVSNPTSLQTSTLVSPGEPAPADLSGMPFPLDTLLGITNLPSLVVFNPQFGMFYSNPLFKPVTLLAIDFAIREVVGPAVDRAVAIACVSSRELILKDFCLDGNEEKLIKAAIQMVQFIAGNLASLTAKEALRTAMASNIRSFLQVSGFETPIPDQAIMAIVDENLDLASAYIEKSAMEKSISDVSESLSAAFALRKKHRERSIQPFVDPAFINASGFYAMVPEALRPQPGGLNPFQLMVYDEFAKPTKWSQLATLGNQRLLRVTQSDYDHAQMQLKKLGSSAPRSPVVEDPSKSILTTQQCLERFLFIITEVEKVVSLNPTLSLSSFPANHELRGLLRQILVVVLHAYNRDEVSLVLSQKVVQLLYKTDSPLLREISVILLDKLCEISTKVAKEVTTWIIYADDERKYNVPVTITLLLSGLLNVVEYDMQMAKVMESGRISAIEFCVKLIRRCVLDEPAIASPYDFVYSIEVLNRIAQRTKGPEALVRLLDDISKKLSNAKDDEANDLRNRIAVVFNDWLRLFQYPSSDEESLVPFISQLQQQGILKDEHVTQLFFRVCTELAVEYYLKNRASPTSVAYEAVDAFSRLAVLLLKYHPTDDKSSLFTVIISVVAMVLVQALDRRNFVVQRPFARLFMALLNDLETYSASFGPFRLQFLVSLTHLLDLIQPKSVPEFAFAWLEIMSHQFLMSSLLANRKTFTFFHKLLLNALVFLEPFLKQVEMKESMRILYRGVLRILLVLLHDFPDFLSDYYYSLCDVIPHTCVQLRNLILSAFPHSMKLPDPFTPDLKVDLLSESAQPPRILGDYGKEIEHMKADIDHCIKNKISAKQIFPFFLEGQDRYRFPVIHAFVLYVGSIGADAMVKNGSTFLGQSPVMELIHSCINEMDAEGRYHLLNAMANQLRYPNSHTHYFSCLLLYLFIESKQEAIREQITRVLLERLIVNRPHPWGLLITFIELIKNPTYNFWNHSFTRMTPDIERLFDSVARSCMVPLKKDENVASAAATTVYSS